MSYYHTPSSTERGPGRLEVKLSDGALLGPPETGWTDELAALCGFVEVAETVPPTPTSAQVAVSTVTLPGGVPTRTWTLRPKTTAELDADKSGTNRSTLTDAARTVYVANRNFLALTTPTNAEVLAQVRRLTRTMQALIRLNVATDLLVDNVID